jgi:hypothetical protein
LADAFYLIVRGTANVYTKSHSDTPGTPSALLSNPCDIYLLCDAIGAIPVLLPSGGAASGGGAIGTAATSSEDKESMILLTSLQANDWFGEIALVH